jgi:hypothetical protein
VSEESPGANGGDEWVAAENCPQLLPHCLRRWLWRLCDRMVWQACTSISASYHHSSCRTA